MKVEIVLQNKIIEYLKTNHIWHLRYTASVVFGLPDVLVLYKGYMIGIEVKREDGKGRSTSLQDKIVESIKRNGGLAKIVASLEEVVAVINGVDSGNVPSEWKDG